MKQSFGVITKLNGAGRKVGPLNLLDAKLQNNALVG